MAPMHRMRRSQTAASGTVVALLGLWGGLIPFIGPYFHYAYTPDKAWDYTTTRLWLEILPGAAAFLGGVLLASARGRMTAAFGAILAAAAGAWFTLGTVLSPLWNHGVALGGTPVGATVAIRIAEQVGFFTGLGVVIAALAALAFGHATALPVVVGRWTRTQADDDAGNTVTQPISR
jgi:hypothetical protein